MIDLNNIEQNGSPEALTDEEKAALLEQGLDYDRMTAALKAVIEFFREYGTEHGVTIREAACFFGFIANKHYEILNDGGVTMSFAQSMLGLGVSQMIDSGNADGLANFGVFPAPDGDEECPGCAVCEGQEGTVH